ncbi:unnamed protein product, partial [Mesorhabditis belari]|uniref:Protein kinase domain-containing protein n=1 Tax=Mesorhabditis belari TaxID=2138241 RepID=A0AAF3FMN0_9BILA
MAENFIGKGSYGHFMRIGEYPSFIGAKYIFIDPNKDSDRYTKEFKLLQKLRHPNIVRFYAQAKTIRDNLTYCVIHMEFCERNSLRHVLNDTELTYSKETVFFWAEHLACALLCLKENQIIHRDIKPENGGIFWKQHSGRLQM